MHACPTVPTHSERRGHPARRPVPSSASPRRMKRNPPLARSSFSNAIGKAQKAEHREGPGSSWRTARLHVTIVVPIAASFADGTAR